MGAGVHLLINWLSLLAELAIGHGSKIRHSTVGENWIGTDPSLTFGACSQVSILILLEL